MRKIAGIFFIGIISAALFFGCSEYTRLYPPQDAGFVFDPEFQPEQESIIREDMNALSQYQFDVAPDSWFVKIFGGSSGADVERYLHERIHYLVPPSVDVSKRVWGYAYTPSPREFRNALGEITSVLAAENIGHELWRLQIRELGEANIKFLMGWFTQIPVNDIRVGIVQVGPRFYQRLDPAGPKEKRVFIKTLRAERIGFLVHEARHSDCTGGLDSEDLDRVRLKQSARNTACGHDHVPCPPGHPFANTFGCEEHPWGASAIQTVFLNALANHCINCPEEEKNRARELEKIHHERILVQGLFSGAYGDPDMKSYGTYPFKKGEQKKLSSWGDVFKFETIQ